MEEKILYVVTVKSYDTKDETGEVSNDGYGVLRIFTRKEDAKAYVEHHYNHIALENCSMSTFENKRGAFRITVQWHDKVNWGVDKTATRTEELDCRQICITKNLKLEESTVEDDIYTEIWE